jgi:hypothetical protein
MASKVAFINETRSSRRVVVESFLDYEGRGDYTSANGLKVECRKGIFTELQIRPQDLNYREVMKTVRKMKITSSLFIGTNEEAKKPGRGLRLCGTYRIFSLFW